MTTPYLGPQYSDAFIESTLKKYNAVYTKLNQEELLDQTTELIKKSLVVGWYQGRQEWGPRALGHRSILGDPRHPKMREIINMKIKMREGFRPFAPSVIEEDCQKYFDLEQTSPYMLLVAPVQEEIQNGETPLPSITHVDGSARVQTVNMIKNLSIMSCYKPLRKKQVVVS